MHFVIIIQNNQYFCFLCSMSGVRDFYREMAILTKGFQGFSLLFDTKALPGST
jgi:predicted nucleic-acid-binding Zn-ribbon protein